MTDAMNINLRRLKKIIGKFPGRRLAVVGDWMLDRYVWGTAARLSPEAPVPVVEFVKEEFVLGGAGNVAANLRALGAEVLPYGVTGDAQGKSTERDEFAGRLLERARELGMKTDGLMGDPGRRTTLKTRVIAGHQQVVRVDRETRAPISGSLEEQLIRRIIAALRRADALVISDYDKGVVTDELANRILSACRKLGRPAFVKPKWSVLPKYPGATAIVLNRKEAGFLVTRALESDAAVTEAGRALLNHFGSPYVVITLGKDGMKVFEQGSEEATHIPALRHELPLGRLGESRSQRAEGGRQVFDVTGAGDTVLATLALACAAGASVGDAAVLANCAAGVVVGKLGTATVTREELTAALAEL